MRGLNTNNISADDIQIHELLSSSGKFGNIYVGQWWDATVAIKKLHAGTDNEQLLRQEALVMLSLNFPSIVRFYGFCSEHYCNAIVMEYYPLGSLENHLSKESMAFRNVLQVAFDVASGLNYLHEAKGIVHRDLKTDNILLSLENNILHGKIADFGLVKHVSSRSQSDVSFNIRPKFIAPVDYLPPEFSALKDNTITISLPINLTISDYHTKACDIYMYGNNILRKMLPPILTMDTEDEDSATVSEYSFSTPIMDFSNCPECTVENIISRCCSTNPEGRYTAQETKTLLQPLLNRSPRRVEDGSFVAHSNKDGKDVDTGAIIRPPSLTEQPRQDSAENENKKRSSAKEVRKSPYKSSNPFTLFRSCVTGRKGFNDTVGEKLSHHSSNDYRVNVT